MTAYYNEIDPYAAQWLRNLIQSGHIAHGEVDERSIVDVHPSDLRNFSQCHFFAGIGVWSHALRLAGWPDDMCVWTGSCPCQPFSAAGRQRGSNDERHLWPAFFDLIRECRPPVVFGEQVAGSAGLAWLDHVCADLEGAGYAAAAVDFPAASVGAPHIRQRLYWVADSKRGATERYRQQLGEPAGRVPSSTPERKRLRDDSWYGGNVGWADAEWIACRDGKSRPIEPGSPPLVDGATSRVGRLRAYGNTIVAPQAAEFIGSYLDIMEAA